VTYNRKFSLWNRWRMRIGNHHRWLLCIGRHVDMGLDHRRSLHTDNYLFLSAYTCLQIDMGLVYTDPYLEEKSKQIYVKKININVKLLAVIFKRKKNRQKK
jgi:hypothetical protein